MRIAYFECFSGISGDMTLGALLDAGAELSEVTAAIDKLDIPGIGLQTHRATRNSIAATAVDVLIAGEPIAEDRAHIHHGHSSRELPEIVEIIEKSDLQSEDKRRSVEVFRRLAAAEARVHGIPVERVHLHEVGALDAIVDVVGSVVALSSLGIERVYSSKLRFGTGFATCSHGKIPIPVPAVVELCKDVPSEQTEVEAELVTPTGAALITTLADGFGSVPAFVQERSGYGCGKRELDEFPNLLRVRIGECSERLQNDQCLMVEANIDDMNPEIFGYLFDILLERGAKDVFVTPVLMKKGRPGQLLSVLVDSTRLDDVAGAILRETTTLGVRHYPVDRKKIHRRSETVSTKFGAIKVKVSEFDGRRRSAPEYDDCARVAKENNVPILSVFSAARSATPEDNSQ
jgi:uncharacterized protein (TIGR00299 family) protein